MAQNAYDTDIVGVWGEVYPTQYTPDGVREIIREEISESIHNPNFTDLILDDAVPIKSVSRGLSRVFFDPTSAANYTVSATTPSNLDETNLSGNITCSGRPVRLEARFSGVATGAGGGLFLGFTWNGAILNGNYLWSTDESTFGCSCWTMMMTPNAGSNRFAVTAYRTVANATVYSGGGNSIEIMAMEI